MKTLKTTKLIVALALSALSLGTIEANAQENFFRAIGSPHQPKVEISWNRYHSAEGLTDWMKKIASAHPDLAKIESIGKSYEGRDIMTDAIDVVVTDGFTGNVALKTLEGSMRSIVKALFAAIGAPQYKEHADAIMPALLDLYAIFDPDSTGGAILLGVDGVCIISHGSSSARAMLNGIKVAQEMAESNMVGLIAEALQLK